MRDGDFEILPPGEMRAKYGLIAENRPYFKLNLANVPEALRDLIPLAEEFGIGDDLIRADVVAKSTPSRLKFLQQTIAVNDDALDEWLAGPDAKGPVFSAEYIAFSCMRMAADGC